MGDRGGNKDKGKKEQQKKAKLKPKEKRKAAKEKKKRPAKVSEHRYDDEAGKYSGMERVCGVILVSADGDIKEMVQRTRLDLEGMGIAVWWKDVQMKTQSTLYRYHAS